MKIIFQILLSSILASLFFVFISFADDHGKIIKERKQAPIQATSSDIAEVKSLLETMNVSDPSMIEKFIGKIKGKNVQQMFDIITKVCAYLQKLIKSIFDIINLNSIEIMNLTSR